MSKHRLVIGVDYGTTYTGVAYCETSSTGQTDGQVQVISNWPAAHSRIGTTEKVPSEVAYTESGIKWGSNIPPKSERQMWTKLELDPRNISEAERIRNENIVSQIGSLDAFKQPVQIIGDLLTGVREHLFESLDEQYGKMLWRTLPVTLVMTVPAVWSDAAKHKTLEAFDKGGFNTSMIPNLDTTLMVTEPEAAAIHTIRSRQDSVTSTQLAVGDGFVICDMGGGTIDLISYRVSGTQPIAIEEITVGTGSQSGGSFVDRGFLSWLEQTLGLDDFIKFAGCPAEKLRRTSLPTQVSKLVQDFALSIKAGFNGEEDQYLTLPYPWSGRDDEDHGLDNGELKLAVPELKKIFQFSLNATKELLTEQIQKAETTGICKIRQVFLVGGFSCSKYVRLEVEELVSTLGNIEVIKPKSPWSAVVRGAVIHGLGHREATTVALRKCRRHYGQCHASHFRSHEHRESDAYTCEFTGVKMVPNQMTWLIRKGDDLRSSAQTHNRMELVHKFWIRKERIVSLTLHACNLDLAPSCSDEDGVYEVAKLKVDLTPLPKTAFRKKRSSDGKQYVEVDYEVEICIHAQIQFSLSYEGERYGIIQATYES